MEHMKVFRVDQFKSEQHALPAVPNGNLYKRQIKSEAAADRYIGKILFGLPVQSTQFASMVQLFF